MLHITTSSAIEVSKFRHSSRLSTEEVDAFNIAMFSPSTTVLKFSKLCGVTFSLAYGYYSLCVRVFSFVMDGYMIGQTPGAFEVFVAL